MAQVMCALGVQDAVAYSKECTQFSHEKWNVDWTDLERAANARNIIMDYHQGLQDKQEWIAEQ
ncbi:hypothetical protein [Burkholderia aenigmatica]|uniref:hypothetical protein n=1 Tax=Burkholderia aenigmatica TaxID=2015348 RepID=UPI00117828AC|nr:hypothetical protein [Burkholderia aenigmatica]